MIYTSQQAINRWIGELPRAHGHWRVCRCIEGACEVHWGWDEQLVGEEREVALTLSLRLEWWILGLDGRYFLDLIPSL